MISVIYTGSTGCCFELDALTPHYAPHAYDVYLDGEKRLSGNTNVFSLFGLKPDREYTLTLDMNGEKDSLSFRTAKEACCINVRQFGAVGDGVQDDTDAIQAAIHFSPRGARLRFPAGVYLCRPLALRSHITLELEKDAVILGCPDRQKYPIIPGTVEDENGGDSIMVGAFEGLTRPMYQSLIHAEYCEDITICGEGCVDGNAGNSDFWTAFREFETARPRLMFFCNCKDVTLHGITGKNGASWNMHPFYSENVSFYDVTVEAPEHSPNTDAIDPEACKGVNIIGCKLSVGDDCIAIKSGKIELCRQRNQAASHHVIRNCLMDFGHGAVTLGSETACGVKDLTVTRCYFLRTDRGLRIKTRRGRGKDCDITGITFDNIHMDGVITPFVINMWYNCCDPDRRSDYVSNRLPYPVDERTPHLGTFTFRDITCEGAQAAACYIDGLPEMPVDQVNFENVRIAFAPDAQPSVPAMQNDEQKRCKLGLYFNNVKKVQIRNVEIKGQEGELLLTSNCGEVEVENLREAT